MMENENFVTKPVRGWLHSDNLIAGQGITYSVRYIGCLQVNTSMKSLDFDTRSQVAKECINRVCEAAKLKTEDRRRKVDKRVQKAIEDKPILENAGANVKLNVSSSFLTLVSLETGQQLVRHDMPRISFACGGDTDTLEFVAYVAKDVHDWRACYVLECGSGLAQEVIATIGQAFELRYQQYLRAPAVPVFNEAAGFDTREYYNDLPGKVPPEDVPPPVPPLPASHNTVVSIPTEPVVSNLIDLRTDDDKAGHTYVNTPAPFPNSTNGTSTLTENVPGDSFDQGEARRLLQSESWFHGCITRQQAESLLTNDGDFLVRESIGSRGQYVLTGMQGGAIRHLLLIDPDGVVRTKDRVFENVNHLVNFHLMNQVPIISAESVLVLREPVAVRQSHLL